MSDKQELPPIIFVLGRTPPVQFQDSSLSRIADVSLYQVPQERVRRTFVKEQNKR